MLGKKARILAIDRKCELSTQTEIEIHEAYNQLNKEVKVRKPE
jgi:hypothetical protein